MPHKASIEHHTTLGSESTLYSAFSIYRAKSVTVVLPIRHTALDHIQLSLKSARSSTQAARHSPCSLQPCQHTEQARDSFKLRRSCSPDFASILKNTLQTTLAPPFLPHGPILLLSSIFASLSHFSGPKYAGEECTFPPFPNAVDIMESQVLMRFLFGNSHPSRRDCKPNYLSFLIPCTKSQLRPHPAC